MQPDKSLCDLALVKSESETSENLTTVYEQGLANSTDELESDPSDLYFNCKKKNGSDEPGPEGLGQFSSRSEGKSR